MKRVLSCGAVALLLIISASDVSAQGKLSGFLAVGPTTTTGDLKDADSTKSGFMVQGGMEYKLTETIVKHLAASSRACRRTRGGYGTKACVIADALGRAIAFRIAPGQAHELPDAIGSCYCLDRVPKRRQQRRYRRFVEQIPVGAESTREELLGSSVR